MKVFYLIILTSWFCNDLFGQNFTEVSIEAGIDHVFRHSGFIGGGVAFFDSDNDGDDDLYITSGREIDHFYINNGDGSFANQNIAAGLFLTSEYYTTGVAFGDVNRDGFQDVFVCTRGDAYNPFGKNFLFLNQRDNTFIDIWAQIEDEDFGYSTNATLFDFNNDGLLDIYVANYVEQAAFIYDNDNSIIGYDHNCFKNFLYENIDGLQFERIDNDITEGTGCSLALCATDIDNDDDQDIFVVNDFGLFISPNALYENIGLSNFESSADKLQVDQAIYGMGICEGDYNNDGAIDYYVSNLGANVLLENNEGVFVDRAVDLNVDDTWFNEDEGWYSISWGCLFADFDNNSYQDIYVANGWISTPDFIDSQLNQNDIYFSNDGGEFTQMNNIGIDNTDVSRGVAYSDYDNDGDLDVLVVSQNVPIGTGGWSTKLFRNDGENLGNYLQIDLEGYFSNLNGFGAKVSLNSNGMEFVQELVGASSHCSQNTSILHFGLDTISMLDTIIVDWLGDIENDTLFNVLPNQRIKIFEDSVLTANDTMVLDTISFNSNPIIEEIKLICYPNPTESILYLSSSTDLNANQIELIDSNGKSYRIAKFSGEIDITDLVPGIYFIKVINHGKVYTTKFVKTE